MANTTITLRYAAGLTLTAKVFPPNSTTIDESVTLSESGTRPGYYTGTLTAASSGLRDLEVWDATSKVADYYIEVQDDTGTYAAYEAPALASIVSGIDTSSLATAANLAIVDTVVDSIATQTTAIVADTNELQTDWANGGRLDLILDNINSTVDTISGSSSITVVTAVNGNTVTVYAYDTWTFAITSGSLGLDTYENLAFVVKSRNATESDATAKLYIRSDTGLMAIGGAAPASSSNGTLTANSDTQFTVTVAIAETGISAGNYVWWLKGFDTTPNPDTGTTIATGVFDIKPAGVQAVV